MDLEIVLWIAEFKCRSWVTHVDPRIAVWNVAFVSWYFSVDPLIPVWILGNVNHVVAMVLLVFHSKSQGFSVDPRIIGYIMLYQCGF